MFSTDLDNLPLDWCRQESEQIIVSRIRDSLEVPEEYIKSKKAVHPILLGEDYVHFNDGIESISSETDSSNESSNDISEEYSVKLFYQNKDGSVNSSSYRRYYIGKGQNFYIRMAGIIVGFAVVTLLLTGKVN